LSPQVLLKENPKVKQVGDTEVFTFNDKFKSKLYRVKIVTIAGPETEKEAQGTREKIDEDRKHQYAFFFPRRRFAQWNVLYLFIYLTGSSQNRSRCGSYHEGPQDHGAQQSHCGGHEAVVRALRPQSYYHQEAHRVAN
jgi:hypothetical protein